MADFPTAWAEEEENPEHLIWRARLFAKIPPDVFEGWIKQYSRRVDSFSVTRIRDKAEEYVETITKAARRIRAVEREGVTVYQGDITQIRSLRGGQVPLVITDPPYRKDDLGLWDHLMQFSDAVLQERGWLLAMSGQRWLPDVMAIMTQAATNTKLRYCWTLAVHTPGAESAQGWIGERNALNIEWKPVFVYSKGEPQTWPEGFRDFVVSDRNDKRFHKWGQSVNVFKELIERFCPERSTASDPFLGGGTSAIAAVKAGRAFEGFDVEEKEVATTIERVNEIERELFE